MVVIRRCFSRIVRNLVLAMANLLCGRCGAQMRMRPTRYKIYFAIAFFGLTFWFMRNLDSYQDELSLVVTLRKAAADEQIGALSSPTRPEAALTSGAGWNNSENGTFQSCKLPVLEIYPAAIKFPKPTPLRCSGDARWTYVRNGRVWFNQSAVEQHGAFECVATPYLRASDFAVATAKEAYAVQNGSLALHDVFRLDCATEQRRKSQSILHHAIPSSDSTSPTSGSAPPISAKQSHERITPKPKNPLRDVNVLLLGFDTMSRLSVIRHLPNTYQYFVNTMRGHVMEAYGVYGDGTPAALCPLLTGISEEELPEARRGFPNATVVDAWPWIWNEYKRAGYVTLWHEETPDYGTFTYRMLGFQKQPVDFYGRNFEIPLTKLVGSASLCYGAEPKYRILLNWLNEFLTLRTHSPKFAVAFHSELTHDVNRIELIDAEVKQLLQSVFEHAQNRNSIVFLFSDHGPRFNAMRRTFQGKYEERLPFMGVALPPDWYSDSWVNEHFKSAELAAKFVRWRTQIVANLQANANVLSLPFDAHATLLDILKLSQLDSVETFGDYNATIEGANARATSLFRPLSPDRNCENLGIKPHWCTCLLWTAVDAQNAVVKKAATYFVSFMNRLLEQVQVDTQCAQLQLAQITSVGKLSANEDVLRFKSSSDQHGRVADLSDTMNLEFFWLQLTVVTSPNQGEYEATIRVYPSSNKDATLAVSETKFEMTVREISRINAYGSAPNCIADQYPHLRPYCYCITV